MDNKNAIEQIREFNRFYTTYLDIFNHHFLESSYNLAEIRILYKLHEQEGMRAHDLGKLLHFDKGYLSRIINGLIKANLIQKSRASTDRRAYDLRLTSEGIILLSQLQEKMNTILSNQLNDLNFWEMQTLVRSMFNIQDILNLKNKESSRISKLVIRDELKPGDIGYMIYLHGKLYAEETGYTHQFEKYVVKTFEEFLNQYEKQKDKIWIAEFNGQIIGCIAIVGRSKQEAQLRWFLVHPRFRGLGLGKKLLRQAVGYCKEKKFQKVYLLTTDMQELAIGMYEKQGFLLTKSEEIEMWGATFFEQRYDLNL